MLHTKKFIYNEKTICNTINELINDSSELFKLLPQYEQNYINDKYGYINKKCKIKKDEDVMMFSIFDPKLLVDNKKQFIKLLNRYIEIYTLLEKPEPEIKPEIKPFQKIIEDYIDSSSLDILLTKPDFFINKYEDGIGRILNNENSGKIFNGKIFYNEVISNNNLEDFLQKKMVADKMTDLIAKENLLVDTDIIFNFQYLINTFFNNKINEYIKRNNLKKESIVFIYKGGTSMKIIFEKYLKLFNEKNSDLKYFDDAFQRSDSDYTILIDKKEYSNPEIYNKIYYDINILTFNILNKIKDFLSEYNNEIFPVNIITDNILLNKLASMNTILEKDLTFFENVEKFIGITFNNRTIMTEDIPDNPIFYNINDPSTNLYNPKINNFIQNKKIDVKRDDFYITVIKNKDDFLPKVITIPNKNTNNGIYQYLNESNYWENYSKGKYTNFLLHRIKINSVLYFKTKNNEYGFIYMPAEVIDIANAKFNDYKLDDYNFQLDHKQYSKIHNNNKLLFYSYTLSGFYNDLLKSLIYEKEFIWDTNKFEKKIKRVIFFILIILNNKYANTTELLNIIKDYFTFIVNNEPTSINIFLLKIKLDSIKIDKEIMNFIKYFYDLYEQKTNYNKLKDVITKYVYENINNFSQLTINSGYNDIPESVPYLQKYIKYKTKYNELLNNRIIVKK
jgi:hypothetical protein